MVTIICQILLCVIYTTAYENLSRRSTTTLSQSSTHYDRFAYYANDNDLRTNYARCAHTDANKSIAWFQVDLGKEYSIKSVKVYYRKEDAKYNWLQYRFKHFYLDVSNSSATMTNTSERTRCYTDRSTGLPDYIIDIPCKQTARYVIVETTYDAPEDDPVTGAFLEICEIQVNGCEIGKYGDGCRDCSGCRTCDVISGVCPSVPCSVNCISGLCDSTTGYCTQGCVNGYWGKTCTSICPQNCQGGSCDSTSGYCNDCSNNYWGQTCNTSCPQNCNRGVCDQKNGSCYNGCTQGRYGLQCENTCNAKCSGNACIQNNGVCTNGCSDFYYGDTCDYECSPYCSPRRCNRVSGTCTGCSSGYFGSSCRETCSVNCAEGTCDQQMGKCHRGCKPSWTGDQCDRCKSGLYGDICNNDCTTCPSGCNRHSGDCEGTCPNDKYGKLCDLPCSPGCSGGCNKYTGMCDHGCVFGKFGVNCSENCNIGCIADCDQNNGRCECKTGWKGDKCDECSSDHYGQSCDQRCSSHCVNGICFSNNGTCVRGCTGTFSNDKCTQENVQPFTTDCDNSMVIVSIVMSVVIVLTGSVVNFLLWRRNQSQNVKRRLKEKSNSHTTVHGLSDIPNSENQVISSYAELGDLDRPNTYEALHQYANAV
ncbi:platelet endothelial aggregation receptor 1-like isoform X2 [Ostrea edulis]|uniref:platelet endothelial aggregation receptor 1-like isoform X2 n=1 Tax=Ostrea edulis TaxID=37623 RepID=UPI0024AEECC7|nr:platelet endothelial aggregation receptor 1-like isoform X2 [Ostrea edulis]